MSKVYGQNPTPAISGVRRQDEFAGSVTQQDSDQGRKQDVAQLGQTLPVVSCWREGGDGGVWISPRLVGLGFEGGYVHFAYIVSEGKTGQIRDEEIWVGQQRLYDILGGASSYGYEELPNGSKVVNQPGRLSSINQNKFVASFFDIDPGIVSKWYQQVISQTGTCTGMEFAITAENNPLQIEVEIRDDSFNLVRTNNFTINANVGTIEVTGLSPSAYNFGITVQSTNTINPTLIGTIEHYQEGDGVTPLPTYKDMTLLGIKAVFLDFFREIDNYEPVQVHAFVRDGIAVTDVRNPTAEAAPTNLYSNLVNRLMRKAIQLDDALIDNPSLALVANMNHKYNLWFNGVLETTTSFQEWIFRTSPYFWASPTQINGKYGLAPVVPLSADGTVKTDAVQPKLVMDLNQIIEGSYNMVMESSKERQDFCCVMVYKGSITRSISETKTVEVRFKEAALEGPYETHDITEFCIDIEHALRAAMYILARRRYVTHTLSVTLRAQTTQLNPGDIIQSDIEITGGTKNKYFYQVDSISEGPDGLVSLALTHFPVNDQNQSLIALAMTQELPEGEAQSGSSTPNTLSDNFVWS